MRTVLCLIVDCDPELRALERALADVSTGGGTLALLAVHDPDEERSLCDRLSTRNFVGQRLTEEVGRVAQETAHEREQEQLEAARRLAEQKGAETTVLQRVGPLVETVRRVAAELQPVRVYVPRLPERLLSRMLRSGATDALVRAVGYPVTVVG